MDKSCRLCLRSSYCLVSHHIENAKDAFSGLTKTFSCNLNEVTFDYHIKSMIGEDCEEFKLNKELADLEDSQ